MGVEDVQPRRAAILAAGWGTFATFSDPDGNGWVLQQAAQDD